MKMPHGRLAGVDKPVSRLCQGCIAFNIDDEEATFGLLDDVRALGCNCVDLGHLYGGGAHERIMGKWMEQRGCRDEMVVLTKCCHQNPDRNRVTRFDLMADLHDSLARLRTDAIDIYVLHRDDPEVEVGRIVDWLNEQVDAGRIRAFGGSNWSRERIAAANAYAEKNGLVPFACSSPHFSLAEMFEPAWAGCIGISGPSEAPARQWYAETGLAVFSWSTLARGFFSGKINRDNYQSVFGGSPNEVAIHAFCHEPNFERLDRAEVLAKEKGAGVPQIALAYVANQPMNIFALLGCYTGQEFQECLEGWSLELTPEEIEWLDLRLDDKP